MKSSIAGTTIIFNSHNSRENAMKTIIDSDIVSAIAHLNKNHQHAAEYLVDQINGLLTAAYFLHCTELCSVRINYTQARLNYRTKNDIYEIQEM